MSWASRLWSCYGGFLAWLRQGSLGQPLRSPVRRRPRATIALMCQGGAMGPNLRHVMLGGRRGRLRPEGSLRRSTGCVPRCACPIPPLAAGQHDRPLMPMCGRSDLPMSEARHMPSAGAFVCPLALRLIGPLQVRAYALMQSGLPSAR